MEAAIGGVAVRASIVGRAANLSVCSSYRPLAEIFNWRSTF
jgi:hypothetical protein